MKVEIQYTKLIKPSNPTPQHLRNYKLSLYDQVVSSKDMRLILFYHPVNGNDHLDVENARRSKRLQKAFSQTLTLFYPLAGRYIEEKLSVDCSDEGGLFVEARVSEKISQFVNGEVTGKILSNLVSLQLESPKSPLVTIQFNKFKCGGHAIGFYQAHKISDGFSFFKFIEAFVTVCREGNIVNVHPLNFDLHSIIPARETAPRLPRGVQSPKTKVSKTFFFSGETILKLTTMITSKVDELGSLKPSSTMVVTAFLWSTLVKVTKAKHEGGLRPSVAIHTLNMRGKTGLPVSNNCFGNFCSLAFAKFIPREDNKIDFLDDVDFVRLLNEAVRKGFNDISIIQNADDALSCASNIQKELTESFDNINAENIFIFTSVTGLVPLYELDCGWGKPFWSSLVHETERGIGLLGTKDGKGIEALICLEENDMLRFQQHPDIIAFTSQGPVT